MAANTSTEFAVGVKLRDIDGRKVQLILDDLCSDEAPGSNWRKWAYFTSIELERDRALSHLLTDAEYASIGQAVLARLLALRSLEQKHD